MTREWEPTDGELNELSTTPVGAEVAFYGERAIARAAQLKLAKWADGGCPHRTMADFDSDRDISLRKRRECGICWEEICRELGAENE